MEVEEIKQTLRELLSGKLSAPEKIAKARQVVEAMTDNPIFPNPDPPLAQLTATIDEFELSYYKAQAAEHLAEESEREYQESAKAFVELMKNQTRH